MSDLIDRDFAIKALSGAMDISDNYHESYGIERAQAIISCLPSAQPQWTPRSEKLPEERTKVLATVLVPHRESIVISAEYLMGTFYCDNGDCWMANDEEVVAWMPLPTPYKGGHDDK